ncbi:PREDICTED: putative peptidyl-tRNA hydrolase PTRHD1 [Tarenaya hassleriana]|uniref:putative peptidyl-tRNA hydrolase PTRHD1 n=1 Tax=Tarenaya hassleriana TaxID=28532 RepID=UPI00053C4A7A|nr:PREDICTED: putative peptidyl-tRNA hydrolase PTRHD1 [Tarenaya hassleriana]
MACAVSGGAIRFPSRLLHRLSHPVLPSRIRRSTIWFRNRRRISTTWSMNPVGGGIDSGEKASRSDGAAAAAENVDDVLVQYVVLRRDLIDSWPLGSVLTQGCHASVAAIWSHKDDPNTVQYCDPQNIDSMHKVTLEVKGETQMMNLSEKLKSGGIAHKLWIEQPENIATCIATKPYPKSQVSSFFKKLKLCK